MKGQFRQLQDKLDSLLDSSQTFSSFKWEDIMTTHRETMEMLTSTNSKLIEESTRAVQALDRKITEVLNKVLLLQSKVKEFMADFRASSDKSTIDMNKVIDAFDSSLKADREALSMIHVDIKLENVDLNSTITTQLDNLKLDLAIENKIMDALGQNTQKAKVVTEKLKHAKLEVARLQDEKFSIKAFNSEIH